LPISLTNTLKSVQESASSLSLTYEILSVTLLLDLARYVTVRQHTWTRAAG